MKIIISLNIAQITQLLVVGLLAFIMLIRLLIDCILYNHSRDVRDKTLPVILLNICFEPG